jgi:hypothetical protein
LIAGDSLTDFGEAMKNIKKTTITIETERVIVLSRLLVREYCRECNEEVEMLAIQDAAIVSGVSQQAICCRIEEDKLHARQTDGQTLICFNSLTQGSKS